MSLSGGKKQEVQGLALGPDIITWASCPNPGKRSSYRLGILRYRRQSYFVVWPTECSKPELESFNHESE